MFSDKTMLIGIGAQKTGTTWLYKYLSDHPDVFMSPYKEAHVFDHRHNYKADQFREILLNRVIDFSEIIKNKKGRGCSELYSRVMNSVEKIAMIDDLDIYMEHFYQRVKGEKVFGEITPAYSLLPKKGFKEILSLHDQVKFIFIMRDPIDRAWSHINDELRRKGLDVPHEED